MVHPYFKNIRRSILKELSEANEEIFVAVYWFTNHQLFDMLCEKVMDGIKVSIIVHNDYINNRDTGLNFQSFIDLGGRFFFSSSDNPMHNKFCIIDKRILINGSYNWTYYAENRNSENILIIKDEPEAISAFRSEFIVLVEQLEQVDTVERLTKFEIDEFNELSARDYLANDIVYEAKATNRPEIVESAFAISPNNLKVQEKAVLFDLTKKRELKCSIGAGIRYNRYLIGVEKGAVLPISISRMVVTSEDRQTSCLGKLYYGDKQFASQNTIIGEVLVKGVPPKPAGKAKLKFVFQIDVFGKLTVKFYSLDNGRSSYFSKNVNGLLATVDPKDDCQVETAEDL